MRKLYLSKMRRRGAFWETERETKNRPLSPSCLPRMLGKSEK